MMNEPGKSDRPVVPEKSPNNAGQPAAEGWREGVWPKGIRHSKTRPGHRAGTTRPVRWSGYVKQQRRIGSCGSPRSCTISITWKRCVAYFSIKREAAPGVDGETWRHYGESLEANLRDLSGRLKRGAYRAKPVRRVYIPKADGRQRPLGVTALEDKIVQRATVEVLNAIYETDFLGFSYGSGRGAARITRWTRSTRLC